MSLTEFFPGNLFRGLYVSDIRSSCRFSCFENHLSRSRRCLSLCGRRHVGVDADDIAVVVTIAVSVSVSVAVDVLVAAKVIR